MLMRKSLRRDSACEIAEANRGGELGQKTARGGMINLAASFARTLIQMSITVFLSRLLSIDDFGVMAMSGTVIVFFAMFSDLGLSGATILQRQVEHQMLSTLFWISTGVGGALFLLCCGLAPLVGYFYSDQRLILVVMFASLSIPLASLGSQHQALLTRQMSWHKISGAAVFSQFAGGVIAILTAWTLSIGFWALALQSVSAAAINTILLWHLCQWRPGSPSRLRDAGHAASFGGYLMAFNAVNYVHRNMDNVIVGHHLGATALGLYSRGYSLFLMPISAIVWPIGSVVTAMLARFQDQRERFALAYNSSLACVFLITAPLAGGLYLFADETVTLFYGAKWIESASVLRILAIGILWQPAYTSGGWIELSLGRSKRHFHASIVSSAIYLVAFLVGVRSGIEGIAKAYIVANMLVVGPWLWWCARGTDITLTGIARAISGPTVALALTVGVVYLATPYVPLAGLANFFLRGLLFGLVYVLAILAWWKVDRGWASMIEFAGSKLISRRRTADDTAA